MTEKEGKKKAETLVECEDISIEKECLSIVIYLTELYWALIRLLLTSTDGTEVRKAKGQSGHGKGD